MKPPKTRTRDGRKITSGIRVRVISEGIESYVGNPAFDIGGLVRIVLRRGSHMLVHPEDLGMPLRLTKS